MIVVKSLISPYVYKQFRRLAFYGNSIAFPLEKQTDLRRSHFSTFREKNIEIRFVFTAKSASGAAVGFWCKTIGFLKQKSQENPPGPGPDPPKNLTRAERGLLSKFGPPFRLPVSSGIDIRKKSKKTQKRKKTLSLSRTMVKKSEGGFL